MNITVMDWVEAADKKFNLKTSIKYALEKGIIIDEIAKGQMRRFKLVLVEKIKKLWGSA